MNIKQAAKEYYNEKMAGTDMVASDGMYFGKNAVFQFAAAFANHLLNSGDYIKKSEVVEMIEELKSMSNNYQVLNDQYIISKNVLDVFIEHIESKLF